VAGPPWAIRAVAVEVAEAEPAAFVPVSRTRIVLSTSAPGGGAFARVSAVSVQLAEVEWIWRPLGTTLSAKTRSLARRMPGSATWKRTNARLSGESVTRMTVSVPKLRFGKRAVTQASPWTAPSPRQATCCLRRASQ